MKHQKMQQVVRELHSKKNARGVSFSWADFAAEKPGALFADVRVDAKIGDGLRTTKPVAESSLSKEQRKTLSELLEILIADAIASEGFAPVDDETDE